MRSQAPAIRGTLLIVLSAACFGAIAIFTALATRAGGDLRGVLFWRYALALPALAAASGGVRALAADPRQAARVALLGGGGQALLAFATLSALAYIPASALGFLFFTFPAWVALFAAVTGAERLTAWRALALGLALSGIAIMVGAPGAADLHPVGVVLALGGAVLYALYIPLLDRLSARVGAIGSTAWVSVGAALALGVVAAVTGAPAALVLPAGSWLPVLGLAVLSTALGFVIFLRGLAILGPVRTAIIATVEPFWTAALGALVLGEPLGGATLAGGGLIALAVLLLQRKAEVGRPTSDSSPTSDSLPDMERLKLDISGMSCQHCVNAVMKALSEVPGVTVERVEIGSAEVAYEPSQVTEQSILDAVNDEGYEATRAT